MSLNNWQLLTNAQLSKPYGSGIDGALTVSANTQFSTDNKSCSGTSGSTTLTIQSSAFTDGDIVLIHQTRGTGAGQWEINYIVSGGGSTSLTLLKNLQYTYTDSGASQAQVVKIPQYTDGTINSSYNWYSPTWDGNVGGIICAAFSGTLSISGNIHSNYAGFDGGQDGAQNSVNAENGESYPGDSSRTTSANGGGGGSEAAFNQGNGHGCGGGYGSAGQGTNPGQTYGSSDLSAIHLGSGGGGNMTTGGGEAADGGNGAGMVILFARNITSPNAIEAKGQDGENKTYDGGGGSGGSILLCGGTVDIGTDKLSTIGSTGVTRNGGKGRIAVYYGSTISGSLSSSLYGSYNAEKDSRLLYPVRRGMFI